MATDGLSIPRIGSTDFGVLAAALHGFQVCSLSDSVLAQMALRRNFAANRLAEDKLHLLTSLELPAEKPDLVLIKAPGTPALLVLRNNPGAHVHCVDESFMAVASARATLQMAFGEDVNASFHAAADLSGFKAGSMDLVLCNPPFHPQQVVGTQIAQGMFRDAARVLRQGGELRIVGNRHLGYHKTLKKLFGNLKLVASNSKFVILRCVKG